MNQKKFLTMVSLLFLLSTATRAFAAEDLLSINKTVIIEIIIFIAAIFILNKLVFKPFIELIDRREKLTKGALNEAKEVEEKVKDIIREYETKINEARVVALEERSKIVKEAETAANGIISQAREETAGLVEEAKHKLETETQAIKEKLKGDVQILAKEIASKILGREAGI
ncbi:MAG: ATP synthase F0 subunit B [Thermodesulfobacteriota bacterium]